MARALRRLLAALGGQPSASVGELAALARIAALIPSSCRSCSPASASNRTWRTCSTWPGAAALSAAKPWSVSTAIWPRRSVGQSIRRTQPRSSSRATAWDTRLLLDEEASASCVIRSERSGASDSRTSIS